ncbi:MAG TPA: hypothetical protein VL994_01040 [Steroidobacteraceae bacterium]|nr:hypothetical protein [Steroidobacteraceae bacterium]
MTSNELPGGRRLGRLVLCCVLAGWTAAHAEGTFFKSRRAALSAGTPAPVAAPPAATAAPGPGTAQPAAPTPPPAATESSAPAHPAAPAPAAPPAAAPRSGTVDRVLTTDTLSVGGQPVQLAGVVGVSGPVTQGLAHYLQTQGNHLSCTPLGTRYRCLTDAGKDVGLIVVLNGAGRAAPDAPHEYQAAENQARANGQGLWHR